MSTVPGRRSWEDAGLTEPTLTDLPEIATDDQPAAEDGSYTPDDARPDLTDDADPGDVAEQRAPVPEDERDDYP